MCGVTDVEHLRLLGPCKVSHTELHLDSTDVDYLILPFSLSRYIFCTPCFRERRRSPLRQSCHYQLA